MARGFLDDATPRDHGGAQKSDLVDVTVHMHVETAKAWRVSDDGVDANAKWVPKSQAEFEPTAVNPKIGILTCPEWLAKEKGLI